MPKHSNRWKITFDLWLALGLKRFVTNFLSDPL